MMWILGELATKVHMEMLHLRQLFQPPISKSFRMGHTVEMRLWQLWWLTSCNAWP
jgi:hypothetical protein